MMGNTRYLLAQLLHTRWPGLHRLLRGLWWRLQRGHAPPDPNSRVSHSQYLRAIQGRIAPEPRSDAQDLSYRICALEQIWSPGRDRLEDQIAEDWVLVLAPDDELLPGAIARISEDVAALPGCRLWYCDLELDRGPGQERELLARTAWDPLRLQSRNDIGGSFAVHRQALQAALGAIRPGSDSTKADPATTLLRALADSLKPGQVVHSASILMRTSTPPAEQSADVHEVTADAALQPVSVIVPTRDGWPHLARCVDAVLDEFAHEAPGCELLVVDNGSVEAETLRYLEALGRREPERVRVLRYDRPFNYSEINNWAVRQARNEILLLLNDDVEAITPGWMSAMQQVLNWRDVGVVGARLLYPDRRIQHAGIAIGLGGVAGHPCRGLPMDDPRLSRWGGDVTRSVSAVTGACLMTRSSIYSAVQGLDETELAVAFNDVDFCLKVRQAGYRVAYVPAATLIHQESVSRGQEDTLARQMRFAGEIRTMQQRWPAWIAADPYYSPHWSLLDSDLSLRWPPAADLQRPRCEA